MKTVPAAKVVTTLEAAESALPAKIQAALGELVGAAREGLLALSVGVGLGVVHELMELEVEEVVGPKSKHDRDRVAKRHGHENGSMTLGGRRVAVRRPRMRSADDERELPVATYEYFADRARGRLTGTRRPPSVIDPASWPCRHAVRSAFHFPFGPTTSSTSASISSCTTRSPTPTLSASSPSLAAPTSSPSAS